ncbi:phage tail protein [Pseudoalteromonas umbrosa]|uniref:phage tail protein n=1 Tax=Pseudoalteromonas umbrosa TaxID=3048489 RepID=UPI0024C4148E|nr:tail fiber protein [Pseudoalteromonas sp. B95]MDK1288481.1 tail fiber protein [Pseudoalteromonas sp. B95]
MDPFIGQVDMLPYTFAPVSYTFCDGQFVDISQNQALFAVIGTTYGGNGQTNMQMPDLQGRSPTMFGTGPGLSPGDLGDRVGLPDVVLMESQLPSHTHELYAGKTIKDGLVDRSNGTGLLSAARATTGGVARVYSSDDLGGSNIYLNPQAVLSNGQNQAHENRQPYLAIQFCICMDGIFPPRS